MANTRYNSDPIRLVKRNQESSDPCRYIFATPGWGTSPGLPVDPHIRLQKWGANLYDNAVDIESNLRNIAQKQNGKDHQRPPTLRRDPITQDELYQGIYPTITTALMTDETRATHPAWAYTIYDPSYFFQDMVHTPYGLWSKDFLPQNPHLATPQLLPFNNNINTQLLEKDAFAQQLRNTKSQHPTFYNQ